MLVRSPEKDPCERVPLESLGSHTLQPSSLQSRDYITKAQKAPGADGVAEVISRLRFSTDQGATYSGDLMAVMEILKNVTELYKASGMRLSNADVEVNAWESVFADRFCADGESGPVSAAISVPKNDFIEASLCYISCYIFLSSFFSPQNYVQTISNLLKEEHHDKWEEAQLVREKRVSEIPGGGGDRKACSCQ